MKVTVTGPKRSARGREVARPAEARGHIFENVLQQFKRRSGRWGYRGSGISTHPHRLDFPEDRLGFGGGGLPATDGSGLSTIE
jgi:hypothetical protein